jgi:hypothetical protein
MVVKTITISLLMILAVTACGVDGAAEGTEPPTTVPSGDEPISEPLPPGEIPQPRQPIPGNIDGEVFVSATNLLIAESFPIQVSLQVEGEKPTPCHEIFWTSEDSGDAIEITMISQTVPDQACAQVIEPFIISVPLGSWADESRDVILNGELVGSFDS